MDTTFEVKLPDCDCAPLISATKLYKNATQIRSMTASELGESFIVN